MVFNGTSTQIDGHFNTISNITTLIIAITTLSRIPKHFLGNHYTILDITTIVPTSQHYLTSEPFKKFPIDNIVAKIYLRVRVRRSSSIAIFKSNIGSATSCQHKYHIVSAISCQHELKIGSSIFFNINQLSVGCTINTVINQPLLANTRYGNQVKCHPLLGS